MVGPTGWCLTSVACSPIHSNSNIVSVTPSAVTFPFNWAVVDTTSVAALRVMVGTVAVAGNVADTDPESAELDTGLAPNTVKKLAPTPEKV